MFGFRLLKVFDIIQYGMGLIHTIKIQKILQKQRNTSKNNLVHLLEK